MSGENRNVSPERNQERTKAMVLARIPAFSPVVLRVLDLLAKDDWDPVKLAREITADATLSAQLLRLANSALFGVSYRIDTVQKAAVAVGHSWIQQLAVSVAAGSYMQAAFQTEELRRCWRHMLATAILCREMAKAAGIAAERAYTVGLLHDIGRLGLLAAFPEEYARALKAAHGDLPALLEEEKKRFGADHCEVGRWLMEDWRLPAEFCSIAGGHHRKPAGDSFELATTVYLACRMADALGYFFMESPQEVTVEEVRSQLPDFARARFAGKPGPWIEIIEQAIAGKSAPVMEHPAPPPPVVEFPIYCEPLRPFPLPLVLAGIVAVLGLAASSHFWR
jgi:putative nucleotidyltransferase with HDIG domain